MEINIPASEIKVGIPGPQTSVQEFSPPTGIIVNPPGNEAIAFDVNEDGIEDIEFTALHTDFNLNSEAARSAVRSMHESLQIAVCNNTDTTFTCMETFQGRVYIFTYTDPQFHSCTGAEAIDTVTNEYPGIYNLGDSMDGNYEWMAGEFILAGYNYANSEFFGQDTVDIIQRFTGTWGAMSEKYLLFRLTESTGSVYGWLKITATKSSVLIFELAYQEI